MAHKVPASHRFVYALASLIILTVGVFAYWYINSTTIVRERNLLITRAQTIASLISPSSVQSLEGSELDLYTPAYTSIKNKLIDLHRVNADTRFVYLMRKVDDNVYFLADSEDPASPDYSPPGQRYEEASDVLMKGFDVTSPYVLEVEADRWGEWISALAPVKDAEGHTIALLGLDKNAQQERITYLVAVAAIALATISLLLFLGLLYHLQSREREIIEMKSDFVAAAAHELRAPLTGIRWSLSSLRRDATLPQSARGPVNDIYERVRGLIDLTNTFLLSASTDHGVMLPSDLKITDLTPSIKEAIEHTTMYALSKQIHVNVTFSLTEQIIVRADVDRLRLVFENLLSNAVKYSPNGSQITFSYENRGSMKVFAIKDQGIGIPHSDLKKIFTGYHRAGNAKKSGILGSGFGLYMAKKIIDFHGGTIVCTSSPGQGSTFTITIPSGV